MGIIGDIGSAINKPFAVVGTFNRHLVDPSLSFGTTSDRYNARDAYRTKYSNAQRNAAGLATGFAVAVPAATAITWLAKGAKVPGNLAGAPRALAIAAGAAALGGASVVAGIKAKQILEDDGNWQSIGTASGIVAGTVGGGLLGAKFAGKWAPVVALGGAIAGGIGGHVAGGAVTFGDGAGHVGEHHEQAPRTDATAGDRVKNFATGAFTHFNEVGPTTNGVSLGYAWNMREIDQKTSTRSERAGQMVGDLGAVGIMGAGALASAGVLAGFSKAASGATGAAGAVEKASSKLVMSPIMDGVQKIGANALGIAAKGGPGAKAMAAGGVLAAAGLTGLAVAKQYDAQLQASGGDTNQAMLAAGLTTAATVGTAVALHATAFKNLSALGAGPRAAASALGAAALISVVSAARLPVQQFMNDTKDSHAANRAAGTTDTPKTIGASAVTGLAAGGLALGALLKGVPGDIQVGKFRIPRAAVIAAGSIAGAGAGAYAGYGLSANMPKLGTETLVAGGAGALAGAGIGAWAKGGGASTLVRAGIGAGVGAAVGVASSAVLTKD